MSGKKITLFFTIFIFLFSVLSFTVSASDPEIQLSTDKETYKPQEQVTITANLKDAKNITFEIDNPKGEILLILTKNTTKEGKAELIFNLSEISEIGDYRVWATAKTEKENATKSLTFEVVLPIPDLTLNSEDIRFSNSNPKEGEKVRIYATIHNIGKNDSKAVVNFFDGNPESGGVQIGKNQPISVLEGKEDDVFVDWTAKPSGTHSIYVIIEDSEPPESDTTNNKACKTIDIIPKEQENKEPICTITFPKKGEKVKGTIIINGKASDIDGNIVKVQVKIDDGEWQDAEFSVNTTSAEIEWNYEWNTKEVENGKHTIFVRALDDKDASSSETGIEVEVENKKEDSGICSLSTLLLVILGVGGAAVAFFRFRH